MVDLISLISDVLISSIQMVMLNDLGKNMFPYRIKTLWKRILIYAIAALIIFGINHIGSTFINIMMVPISYIIAAIAIFKGSTWKKIILACCYYMLAIVPEFLFAVITEAYGVTGTENSFHSEIEKLLSLLLMSTITFLLVKCVNQMSRRKDYLTVENRFFTTLLGLPIATILILACMYYSHMSFSGINRVLISVGAILLLMTNIFIFAVFDKLIEKSEEAKNMELLYQKSRAENINLQYMNKVDKDNRAFLHDVNKFIHTAVNLMGRGENRELEEIAEHLGIRIEQLSNYNYCTEPILNSILCERKFIAESKAISYKSLIALEPSAYMRIAFMAKLMESKDKLSQITILPYSIEQYSFEEEISGILCMGVLGHLNMEERKHLWKILDDKLKKNVPILIEVLDPRFLEIKKGTRIAVAFQGRLRYETYVTDVKYSSGKRWEWLLTYRVSYGEKIINEVNSPMWWNYDRIEDILTELAQVNFRGIKLGETLLLAIKN